MVGIGSGTTIVYAVDRIGNSDITFFLFELNTHSLYALSAHRLLVGGLA